MSSVLTLKFDSLLQSFGTHSVSLHRDTDTLPTKSQVIGMVLNAMGHDKYVLDEESRYLPKKVSGLVRFGAMQVKKSYKGEVVNLMTDFCIARRRNKSNEIKDNDVLYKDYIVNSKYKVFLEGNDEYIQYIAKFLLHPNRQIYVGRKCCTIHNPICWNDGIPTITTNTCIEEVFLKEIDLSKSISLPLHIIECSKEMEFDKKVISEDLCSLINTYLGVDRWFPTFQIKKKTTPIQFGKQQWGDMLCYKLSYLRYGDMIEIESE